MSNAILPFELILTVLSNLKDQTTDLRSCALVCDGWRTESQAFLFHTVILTTIKQCHQLYSLLTDSPHIATLIKEISFNLDVGILDKPTLVVMDTTLRSLRLKSLSLGALCELLDKSSLNDLPPILREAIAFSLGHASLSSLKLRSFAISNVDLHTLFMRAPGLRCLSLSNISSKQSNGEEDPVGQTSTSIEELVIESEDGIFQWLCQPYCSVDLACLRSLTIVDGIDDNKCGFIDAVLKNAGPSLESLYLRRVNERPMKDGVCLDFTHISNLRSLHLNLAPDDRYLASRCPPKWVLSTLERMIPSPVTIEKLVLDIGIIDAWSFKRTDNGRWRQMAALLSSTSFPGLQCVRIAVIDPVTHLPVIEDLATQAIQGLGVVWAFEMVEMATNHILRS
ncbi:hypothetical protein C0991_009961 [Blastosporella zonata]|nr:hypothetical protein C0991_009961 [Blastosporella zonata]